MAPKDPWTLVVDLIERVMAEDELLPAVVAGVRSSVREVGGLASADIAGHTRALLAAATRALAARRGPTDAELSFVAELGVVRARQGIPIEAVLGAIHVAERAIWSRAREVAEQDGVPAELLLDARELYDDWSEAVRARLIVAHRTAGHDQGPAAGNRDAGLLRRLLEGGSVASLAIAEAGLPTAGGLWVLVRRGRGAGSVALERAARAQGPALAAQLDGVLVAVVSRPPFLVAGARDDGATGLNDQTDQTDRTGPTGPTGPTGMAGPVGPEELGAARRLALAALVAAEAVGRTGAVHVAEVAVLAAVTDRSDLAGALLDRYRGAHATLGSHAAGVARTVGAWLEADRDVATAAAALFVHPNTVRNRVQRFVDVTGLDPHATFGGVDAWWLCRAWATSGKPA